MNESRSFYVTVLSVNDAWEFPENTAASFKARLPYALPDRPEEWEVGLVGLFMPGLNTPSTAAVTSTRLGKLLHGLTDETPLFRLRADLDTGEVLQSDYTVKDALQTPHPPTGVKWMRRAIEELTQSLYRKMPHGKRWWHEGKKTTMTFRWKGNQLVLDNQNTLLARDIVPYFGIYKTLALRMGWIEEGDLMTTGDGYHLGKNLLVDLPDPQAAFPDPSDDRIAGITGWSFSRVDPMNVYGQFLYLSNAFNWRFARLNEAMAVWDQHDAEHEKAVFVYSDVICSNLVGDTMSDLLRIVPYKGDAQWWEPKHIEFHTLRGPSLTIVEVNLAWGTGDLLTFPPNTVSHLRLRRRR